MAATRFSNGSRTQTKRTTRDDRPGGRASLEKASGNAWGAGTSPRQGTAVGSQGGSAPPGGGQGALVRTLPFEAVPATPLREHFTRWLVRSLDEVGVKAGTEIGADAPTEVAPASETAPAAEPKAKAEPCTGVRGERVRRFVRRGDGAVWVTKPLLRSRGWTEAAIRDFLPEPEGLKPNPRFAATGAPMQVWRPETVAAAEAGSEWQDWLERSLRRRKTTLEALAESKDPDFKVRVAGVDAAITACRKGLPVAESKSEAVKPEAESVAP